MADSAEPAYAIGRLARGSRNGLRLDGRSLLQKLVDVVHAKGDKPGIDENVAGERDQHVARRERGCDRVFGAQQAVDDPRLASDLGGVPAGQDGDEAGRKGEEGSPQKPARRFQSAAETQEVPEPGDGEHDQSHPHHDAEAEEWDQHRRPVLRREGYPARSRARSSCRRR